MNTDQLADSRTALHAGHASQRILSKNHDRVGLAGEAAFAEWSGLDLDDTARPGGDRGIDFTLASGLTVDVKTARKPYNLICEVGKVDADIYALALYHDDGPAELIGWAWGTALRESPTREFGHGVLNHYIPSARLAPLESLRPHLAPAAF